jgi:hypothetical protein
MSPEDYKRYRALMNASCDAMIEAGELLSESGAINDRQLELAEELSERALELHNFAIELAKQIPAAGSL